MVHSTSSAVELSSDQILQHIPDGIVVLDLDGRILYANDAFGKMVGRPARELGGRRADELFDEVTCRRIEPRFLLRDGEDVQLHFDLSLPAKGGGAGSYCFMAAPVRDRHGRVVGLLENFRSMDRLREVILELEEVHRIIRDEKDRTDGVLDSVADGVFTVDLDGRIVSFSEKMQTLTGIAAEDAVGHRCADVLHGSKCGEDCPLEWTYAHGKTISRCQETIRDVAGEPIPVSVSTALLHDVRGNLAGLTGIVDDRSEIEQLRRQVSQRGDFHGMIGTSRSMRNVFATIETVADSDATVLITGESGTGKDSVARAIHERSSRRDRPLVTVNCGALNDDLLESELFGHVRDAFPGAVKAKPGRFELAGGGTVLLDEIGDTGPSLQAKLLRALEQRTFARVGGTHTQPVDFRVVAATSEDLVGRVHAGRFREDLYDRLAVVPIQLPPLRARREDIPLLALHFIDKYLPRYYPGRRKELFAGISSRALAVLMGYDWPGNVHELERTIEYAMIATTTHRIERAFLPPPLNTASGSGEVPAAAVTAAGSEPRADSEVERLRAALVRNRWNATRTARELGLSRTTLWRRMKRYGLLQSEA